jgi:Flp pilus assembly protein TadG
MAQIQNLQPPHHRGGNVAIEFGVVLPVLLMFVLGIIDLGRFFWTYTTLTRATEAAARCGAVNNTALCSNISNYAQSEAWGLANVSPSTFTAANAACGVQVSASYTFAFLIPWMGTASITLTPASCFPKQFS